MSKSLKRVIADAEARGLDIAPVKLEAGTLTAADAAAACGCEVDQIIKSVVLREIGADRHFLFLTAGGDRVDLDKAAALTGCALEMGDAASIRAHTGFAIGGVSPLGHLNPIDCWMSPRIFDFDEIWAAAGTPHHVFRIAPEALRDALRPHVEPFT